MKSKKKILIYMALIGLSVVLATLNFDSVLERSILYLQKMKKRRMQTTENRRDKEIVYFKDLKLTEDLQVNFFSLT